MSPACLDANVALDFVDGRLGDASRPAVEDHIADCDQCRRLVADLVRSASVGHGSRDDDEYPVADQLPLGAVVGRYVIGRFRGRGGMGVVYEAHDPELDRLVAIKLLRAIGSDERPDAAARSRALREAQALAKLSHPNVVAVYDVGELDSDVYVAMELIDGVTLREWLAETVRDHRDIVRVFVAAARGLAAAHERGLVHRDFKPDNVIIGDDGRVRVVDFGLVRAVGEEAAGSEGIFTVSEVLTRTGTVVGTPAYMAPEQHAGGAVDARTDQFSFCVSLYQALFRERPFAGDDPRALAAATQRGELRSAPAGIAVPGWIRRVVVRGLATDPGDRYASMHDLIDALVVDPVARRTRLGAIAAVVAVTVLAVVATWQWLGREDDSATLCATADAHLVSVWDEEVRSTIGTSFEASQHPASAETLARVTRVLDDYTRDWTTMRTETCRATRVHGEQSEHVMDLRMRCLDRRLAAIEALTERLQQPLQPPAVDNSLLAAVGLPSLDECADATALERSVPLPSDPTVLAALDSLEAARERASTQLELGEVRAARDAAERIELEARELGFAPAHIRVLVLLGRARFEVGEYAEAEATLREAIQLGARLGEDRLIARAWTQLIPVLTEQGKFHQATDLEPVVDAAISRMGGDDRLRVTALRYFGDAYSWHLQYELAVARLAEAVALAERALGPSDRDLGAALAGYGEMLAEAGSSAKAVDVAERAIELQASVLGPEHRTVAWSHVLLGRALRAHGEWARAQQTIDAAIAMLSRTDPSHPSLHYAHREVAWILVELGDSTGAEQRFVRALDIAEAGYGEDDYRVSLLLIDLASLLRERGEAARALPYAERAVVVRRAARGSDHISVGHALFELARVEHDLGRFDDAVGLYEQALVVYEIHHDDYSKGATKGRMAVSLVATGQAEHRARVVTLVREARELLERANATDALAKLAAFVAAYVD